jgi:Gamma-glutamyl cyclotransferase, AIG2-like
MTPNEGLQAEVWLFSYGILRQREVQLAIFGRGLDGRADVLRGYTLSPLQITDPGVITTSGTAHHAIVRETGDPLDAVPGIVFRISRADLAAANAYEVADCKRVTVRLGSGIEAFVYVDARP